MKAVIPALGLVLISAAASAQAPAGVPSNWLCRADRMTVCNDGDCHSTSANVTAEVDFEAMTLQNFSLDEPTILTSVRKSKYSEKVYFSSGEGQMYLLDNRKQKSFGGATVWDWQMVTTTSGRNSLIYYGECRAR